MQVTETDVFGEDKESGRDEGQQAAKVEAQECWVYEGLGHATTAWNWSLLLI